MLSRDLRAATLWQVRAIYVRPALPTTRSTSSPANPGPAWRFRIQAHTDWERPAIRGADDRRKSHDLNARCHQPFFAGGVGLSPSLGVVSISSFTGPNRSCADETGEGDSEVGAVGEGEN